MLSSILSRLWSDLPSNFDYTVGSKAANVVDGIFELYEGEASNDRRRVSIFLFNKKNYSQSSAEYEWASNCLKHMKTLRHPNILRTLEAVEVPSGIYIVTEPAMPISSAGIRFDPCWPVYELLSAVYFIHSVCNISHHLISPYTVYATDKGNWKLGGFDLAVASSSCPSRNFSEGKFRHPFAKRSTANYNSDTNPYTDDLRALGKLICWIFGCQNDPTIDYGSYCDLKAVPAGLKGDIKGWIDGTTKQQFTKDSLRPLVKNGAFFKENCYVQTMLFLNNISVKTVVDRDNFFERLPQKLELIPPEVQKLQILPNVMEEVMRSSNPVLYIAAIFKISEAIPQEEYKVHFVPILTKLIEMPERLVRLTLLRNLHLYEAHLDMEIVSNVFEDIALGFTDSSGPVREATLKSMVIFFPLLRPALMEKALKLMATLIKDPETTIRTNAIICFAKISRAIPKHSQTKVLLHAYTTGLADKFPSCRIGTLQALAATGTIFTVVQITNKILPLICRHCNDADPEVRSLAFHALETLIHYAKGILVEKMSEEAAIPFAQIQQLSSSDDSSGEKWWTSWGWRKSSNITTHTAVEGITAGALDTVNTINAPPIGNPATRNRRSSTSSASPPSDDRPVASTVNGFDLIMTESHSAANTHQPKISTFVQNVAKLEQSQALGSDGELAQNISKESDTDPRLFNSTNKSMDSSRRNGSSDKIPKRSQPHNIPLGQRSTALLTSVTQNPPRDDQTKAKLPQGDDFWSEFDL